MYDLRMARGRGCSERHLAPFFHILLWEHEEAAEYLSNKNWRKGGSEKGARHLLKNCLFFRSLKYLLQAPPILF